MDGIYFVAYKIGTIHFFKITLIHEKIPAVFDLVYGKNKHKIKTDLLGFVGVEDNFVCWVVY